MKKIIIDVIILIILIIIFAGGIMFVKLDGGLYYSLVSLDEESRLLIFFGVTTIPLVAMWFND